VSGRSFAQYLAGLSEESLTAILRRRPDARTPPPRGFVQLAQRLDGADSLAAALLTINQDVTTVGQAAAILGEAASVPVLAGLLDAADGAVHKVVAELCGCGLAWESDGAVRLPQRLASHWSAEIETSRPLAAMASRVRISELKQAAEARGLTVHGLGKADLVASLSESLTDTESVMTAITRLPAPARRRLDELRHNFPSSYYYGGPGAHSRGPGADPAMATLIGAGLVLLVDARLPELPREVAVAAGLVERKLRLTGPPLLPAAKADDEATRLASQSTAQEAVRSLTAMLDDARARPLAALKRGGIGTRERVRTAKALSISEATVSLWIDLAYAAGLVDLGDAGYAPTAAYEQWRDAAPGERWALLAAVWIALEHAPTSRATHDDQEVPPPLPLGSAAGALRRSLLAAARPGVSVAAVARKIGWFFPTDLYDDAARRALADATIREAELLGLVAADRVSQLGEQLLAGVEGQPDDLVADLSRRCAALVPEASWSIVVQSDLTAVVAGQPSAAVSRLLTCAAVPEARGSADVWRFTPTSIRGALDDGWTAETILAELNAVSDRRLPQALEYLVADAARRHGQVRVRGMRACVLADEPTTTEILHTRSLKKLQFSQLAPTVLASPFELAEVLRALRGAGLSPVAEDATGVAIIENRRDHHAAARSTSRGVSRRASRPQVRPSELARQLMEDPSGEAARPTVGTATLESLKGLNRRLNNAELELLADAVDNCHEVLIGYRDANGKRTLREIAPQSFYGKWIDSWCYLRNAQRDFTVANIESVAPAG
jgi:hypothetical protein